MSLEVAERFESDHVRQTLGFGAAWARNVAFVVWAAMTAHTAVGHAAPRTFVALQYEVATDTQGCPDIEQFQSNVEHQLGYDPFRPVAERRVLVQIARKATGFDGWIKWSDASGHWVGDRRLSSRRSECGEIASNVAFAVAVQIQLLATLAPTTTQPSQPSNVKAGSKANAGASSSANAGSSSSANAGVSPNANADSAPTLASGQGAAPSAAPSSAAESAASAAPGQPPASRARLSLSAGVSPSLGLGIAPSPAALGRIFVSGRVARLSLEIGVDAALPTSRTQADGRGFSLARFAAGAAACGHVQALAACVTGTLGRFEASGFGVDKRASPTGLFVQVGGRLAATHDFGDRYFVGARIEGLVMLRPWTVTLDSTVIWRTPRVGGLLGLDLGLRFF